VNAPANTAVGVLLDTYELDLAGLSDAAEARVLEHLATRCDELDVTTVSLVLKHFRTAGDMGLRLRLSQLYGVGIPDHTGAGRPAPPPMTAATVHAVRQLDMVSVPYGPGSRCATAVLNLVVACDGGSGALLRFLADVWDGPAALGGSTLGDYLDAFASASEGTRP
jgi:hypothetical protein